MVPEPYAGMTDAQVLAHAADCLRKANKLPPGSPERGIQQSGFDSAMLELGWRAIRYALASIAEADERAT